MVYRKIITLIFDTNLCIFKKNLSMLKRLLRAICFPLAIIATIIGVIQWVFTGKNIGTALMNYSVIGKWEYES